MEIEQVIGIDLGGTQVRAGIVTEKTVTNLVSGLIPGTGTVDRVLEVLYQHVDPLVNKSTVAIGIGVPSVVDIEKGIVYNVQNIPSWKEVPLKSLMEERYHIPVFLNNDANCFALGEKYFGKGQQAHSMIGLTIGTGLGSGIIINDKLFAGVNCGAGEFGEVDYLDHNYEYYASGQFFSNCYGKSGKVVYKEALAGDKQAISIFEEFGIHLGNVIKMILYSYDPEMIILGGSIKDAYSLFEKTMWQRIHTFSYPKSLEHFILCVSDLESCGVLGAASLYYDRKRS
jgi:glucokinase